DELEVELAIEHRLDRVTRSDQQERIAVGRRTHDRLGADIAAGAWPVLDDKWLAEPLRQPLTHQAREDVLRAARGKADDDTHRPRWITLRPCGPRDGRERGSARGQMQEFAAGELPLVFLCN